MYQLGRTSISRLETCHEDIQKVIRASIETAPFDFGVVCGRRSKEDQTEAFENGYSKVEWPDSNHNVLNPDDLCNAVDIAPYGCDPQTGNNGYLWNAPDEDWIELAEHVMMTAEALGVSLRWGGDWDGDGVTRSQGDTDERFVDYPHFELAGV